MTVKIFTDASFWGNPQQKLNTNVGIFIPTYNIKIKKQIRTRDNNEGEYYAIYEALLILQNVIQDKIALEIVTDSKVCSFSLNEFVTTGKCRENKYMKIQRKIIELIERIVLDVQFVHQKAHSRFDGTINWLGNFIVDKISKTKMTESDSTHYEKYLKIFNEIFFVKKNVKIEKTYVSAWD